MPEAAAAAAAALALAAVEIGAAWPGRGGPDPELDLVLDTVIGHARAGSDDAVDREGRRDILKVSSE